MGNRKSEILINGKSEIGNPWNPGTLKLWNSGTLELWNTGTLELWNS